MSLFNNAMSEAADTTDVQAGGKGFFEGAADALTMGAGSAVLSGLGSIYNTAAAGINMLGGSVEELNTYKTLQNLDTNWADYYKANQSAIDVTGFIGTSMVPGTLAIKALNLARGGASVGAVGRTLNFARTQQAASLDAALVELAAEGGTVFTRINKNKLAAMAWGVADQTLTAAAFETGVALTMKQSPMLADDSWWDIGKSAAIGAAFGGVIGGGIDSLLLNKGFKNAVKALDGKQRNYDYLQNISGFNMTAGDKAFAIVDSLTKLPTEVLASDKLLELSFHLAGGPTKKSIDISKLLGNTLDKTQDTGLLKLQLALGELSTDSTVTQSFAHFALERFSRSKASGADSSVVRDDMGALLFELKGLKAATTEPTVTAGDLWYFNKNLKGKLAADAGIDEWEAALRSSTPFTDNAYNKPYVFTGTSEQMLESFTKAAKIGIKDGEFLTLTAAWKAGHDVAMMPDGAFRVNDASKLWRRVEDPVYKSSRFLNTKTGALTEDTVLTAADLLVAGKTLGEDSIKKGAVYLETASGTKVLDMIKFNPAGNTEYFTARHAWASKLADADIPKAIDVTDFSLMDRLASYKNTATDGSPSGIQLFKGGQLLGDLEEFGIKELSSSMKLSEAEKLFDNAASNHISLDTRAVAYQLNVDAQWLEEAVASRFKAVSTSTAGDLSSYTRRENLVADMSRPQQFAELPALTPNMPWRERRQLVLDAVNNNGGQFVSGELAWGQRVRDAIAINQSAAAAAMGSARMNLLPVIAQDAARTANTQGAGATMLGAANAGYGDGLALGAQTSGKFVNMWIAEDVKAVIDALSSLTLAVQAKPLASAEWGVLTNLIRSSASEDKYVWSAINPKQLVLKELGALEGKAAEYAEALASITGNGRRAVIDIQSDELTALLKAHHQQNSLRTQKRTVLINAKGATSNIDPAVFYVPPIDTTYFKHFAFVRPIKGRAFSTSEVSMVFGRDADELSKRMASIERGNFAVITKGETEEFFKAKELYDFNLTMNEPRINSELKKTGALNNFQPEVRGENLAEDYLRWHQNQAGRLVRDSVETHYAQQFAELKQLGTTYSEIANSRFSGSSTKTSTEIVNPYDDYRKTALDVSKRSEYTFLHQANEFVDALGTRAYQGLQSLMSDASKQKGMATYTEVNAQMEKLGIKGVYNNQQELFTANVPRDRNVVREYISKANAFLANTVLRLDFFNGIVNTISTPLMLGTELTSLKSLAKSDPALIGKLSELLSVTSPTGIAVPSNTKLIGQAIHNWGSQEKQGLLARYMANGDVTDALQQHSSVMGSLALRSDFKTFSDGVNNAFEMGAKITGNNLAEQFTRFISADVMRQLSDPLVTAGKLSLKEQNAYISVFVNRVQGNYVTSQRPIVFQGVLGSAVSLFQTYSFNLMQQLLRHVENGDKRAVATLFGLQAGTFGLNGTPFFEAVNTHLIGNASINQGHYDAYSVAPTILGKKAADWLMYGTASAMPAFLGASNWPALYTRGDINPRHMSVIPLNPLDVPAVDASTRIVSNLMDVGKKLVTGADVGETLLQGLEHNGVSRPLAGLAQVLNGKSTTSKGSLIAASNDWFSIANAGRIMGAKPMDEAVALNNQYRMKAYQVADADRQAQLGERVKSYLYKNQFPPDDVMDGFMKDYARVGGRMENFSKAMQHWSNNANVSVVEKMRAKMSSSYGQRLSEIMGGTPLEDYRNQPVAMELPAPTGLE